MYHFTMTIICADWTVGKDVEGLTSIVCDEHIIMHHVLESSGINLGSRSWFRLLERAVLLRKVGVFVEHI